MKKPRIIEKSLAIGVIILFFTMATISVVGISNVKTPLNKGDEPIPGVEGIMGENNWYISLVIISFSYDPKLVDEIQYYLGGGWHVYNNPFSVEDDGIYSIEWYWVDEDGKSHDGSPIFFKIDQTPPTIQLNKKTGNNQITFTATCSDSTSDVELVEFYLDDELIQTIISAPYEYVWTSVGKHYVHAVGYNFAGLSAESETLDTTSKARTLNFQFLNSFFQRIYQIFFWFQQINLN